MRKRVINRVLKGGYVSREDQQIQGIKKIIKEYKQSNNKNK